MLIYEALNRLTSASDSGGWSHSYGYDQFGNMWLASQTGPAQSSLMPTQSSNISASTNQVSGTGVSYDTLGRATQMTAVSDSLTYDAENRVVSDYNSTTATTTNYTYDGLGQRIAKSIVGGVSTVYVYDAFGNLAVEYATGTVPAPLCTTCNVSSDALGSTRMVTNPTGAALASHDYYPFGAEVAGAGRGAAWGTTDNISQKFTGQERDTETGLDHFPARHFGSAIGRFMVPDPAGNFVASVTNPQSWNMYSYVFNNPLAFIDQTGMSCTYNDGDPDNPVGDDGDGLGCPAVGVAPGDPNDPNTITPQRVNVGAQQESWLTYFFADLGGYTQPAVAQNQVYSPPLTVYVRPGSTTTQAPKQAQKEKPSLAACVFAPHEFNQIAYGGPPIPADPLVGNNNAVPQFYTDVVARRSSSPQGTTQSVGNSGQFVANSAALAANLLSNSISDCAPLMAK